MIKEFKPDISQIKVLFPELVDLQEIGPGGQKLVYSAKHPEHGLIVLKLIKPGSPTTRQRTLRELYIASELKGACFAKLHGFGDINIENEEVIFIMEEYIDGNTLRALIQAKSLSLKEIILIGKELLHALDVVDQKGLVHRDVKPENIIVSKSRIVLLDFGIARHLNLSSLTDDMAMFGPMTPGYAAPEQIKNEKRRICSRTDLFSWGVVMYECITGKNPFIDGCATPQEILIKTIKYNPPTILEINYKFSKVIDKCLKKVIHRRPISAKMVLENLEGCEKDLCP
ncbi:protein kinase [Desulforamulus reducens MI-1]|uniref:Protein kinase n=1 Tax=Desulforamulus reducens (strain ATCC BAA-1160 / DSM 100696 / MI-1) TaxID=349161 RepID=A4J2M1_DESRM|nr:serine/threonine-protein kinase [Desulforamulus reducens]ABO49324.1 protein kinase [Desulforamulus reducens MI-1]